MVVSRHKAPKKVKKKEEKERAFDKGSISGSGQS